MWLDISVKALAVIGLLSIVRYLFYRIGFWYLYQDYKKKQAERWKIK